MDNIYAASGVTAIFVSVAMQILKNTPLFPWLSRNSGKLNAAISVLAAFATSVGIIYSFDYDELTGAFLFNIHGNLWDAWHVITHTAGQWATQHLFYKGFIVPAETLGEMRAMLANALTPPPVSPGAEKAKLDAPVIETANQLLQKKEGF